MTKKQILQILNDRSTYILDFKDETHNAIELEDFNYVADAILSLYSSSLLLKEKEIPDFDEWLQYQQKDIKFDKYILNDTYLTKAQMFEYWESDKQNL